jgi:hypothetical protein
MEHQKSYVGALVLGVLVLALSSRQPVSAADEPRLLKVVASQGWSNNRREIGPLVFARESTHAKATLVIRTPAELAVQTPQAIKESKKAEDPAFQKIVAAELAKLLKVETIDWDKQMVLVIWDAANTRGPRGEVEFVSLKVQGDTLTVGWRLKGRGADMYPQPRGVALVERHKGKVVFDPPAKK